MTVELVDEYAASSPSDEDHPEACALHCYTAPRVPWWDRAPAVPVVKWIENTLYGLTSLPRLTSCSPASVFWDHLSKESTCTHILT